MDMANAFLRHIDSDKTAKQVRNVIEFSAKEQDEDEFAQEYGLV